MDTVGVGVVGCGFVGYGAHVPAFKTIEGSRLVAVSDADAGRLKKIAQKYQVKTYADYQDLVKDPEIQAVVVAVPTTLHAPVALAAIAAGKHVLCEMPLAVTVSEADKIIAAARQRGVYLMPSLTFRFSPPFVKVKQLIEQGAIGEPSSISYREYIAAKDLARQWPPGSWVWNLKESGGPLFTLAVWSVDLVRWLLGTELTEVHSAVKYTPLPQFGGTLGYDAAATAPLANGVAACFQFSGSVADSASSCTLEVVGSSTALVKTTAHESVTLFADDPFKTEWLVKQSGPGMWGHLQQDEHFIRCLQQGRQPSITPEDGLIAMKAAEQIAKVAR